MGDAKMSARARVNAEKGVPSAWDVECGAAGRDSGGQWIGKETAIRLCEAHAAAATAEARERIAELEALLRETQDLFMEAGPFHALRPTAQANWTRRARAHITALASALAKEVRP